MYKILYNFFPSNKAEALKQCWCYSIKAALNNDRISNIHMLQQLETNWFSLYVRVTGHFAQKTFRTSLLAQVLDHSHNS